MLALACPGVLRQRPIGWVLALSTDNENDEFERYCRALDELEDAWRTGYGDPQQPFAVRWVNDVHALRALTAALEETTDLAQAQASVLSGAIPFPGGIPGKAW